MRTDLQLIPQWVKPKSKVLDLGCGDGELLSVLQQQLACTAYGLEIDHASILSCIQKNVNIIQSDLDNGLDNFESNSFDTVIMTQSLQAMTYPDKLIQEMLRVGKEAIISFPNMGHWRSRWQLCKGQMPVTKTLPHAWYNTPNIHLCTLRDFEKLCKKMDISIIERVVLNNAHRSNSLMQILPNLFAELAIYRFKRK